MSDERYVLSQLRDLQRKIDFIGDILIQAVSCLLAAPAIIYANHAHGNSFKEWGGFAVAAAIYIFMQYTATKIFYNR